MMAYAGVGWRVSVGRGVSLGVRVSDGVNVGRMVDVRDANITFVGVSAVWREVNIPSRMAVTTPVKVTRTARESIPAKKGNM